MVGRFGINASPMWHKALSSRPLPQLIMAAISLWAGAAWSDGPSAAAFLYGQCPTNGLNILGRIFISGSRFIASSSSSLFWLDQTKAQRNLATPYRSTANMQKKPVGIGLVGSVLWVDARKCISCSWWTGSIALTRCRMLADIDQSTARKSAAELGFKRQQATEKSRL